MLRHGDYVCANMRMAVAKCRPVARLTGGEMLQPGQERFGIAREAVDAGLQRHGFGRELGGFETERRFEIVQQPRQPFGVCFEPGNKMPPREQVGRWLRAASRSCCQLGFQGRKGRADKSRSARLQPREGFFADAHTVGDAFAEKRAKQRGADDFDQPLLRREKGSGQVAAVGGGNVSRRQAVRALSCCTSCRNGRSSARGCVQRSRFRSNNSTRSVTPM